MSCTRPMIIITRLGTLYLFQVPVKDMGMAQYRSFERTGMTTFVARWAQEPKGNLTNSMSSNADVFAALGKPWIPGPEMPYTYALLQTTGCNIRCNCSCTMMIAHLKYGICHILSHFSTAKLSDGARPGFSEGPFRLRAGDMIPMTRTWISRKFDKSKQPFYVLFTW